MPGVVLNQVVLWFTSGVFNVQAEGAIAWPQEQSVAELKLTFVKVAKNAGALALALIHLMPLVAGLLVITVITSSIFNLDGILQEATESGEPVAFILQGLASIPDLFIWVYMIFTVANTMIPNLALLKPLRTIAIVIAGLTVLGVASGTLSEVIAEALLTSLSQIAGGLTIILLAIVGADLLVTGALGIIESVIERITGDSATFQNGKLVAMRREDILKQREKERKQREAAAKRQVERPLGSIYAFPLPTPTAPSRDLTAKITGERLSLLDREETQGAHAPVPLFDLSDQETISSDAESDDDATKLSADETPELRSDNE